MRFQDKNGIPPVNKLPKKMHEYVKKHRTGGFINCIQTIDIIVFQKTCRGHQRFKGFLVALLATNPAKKSPWASEYHVLKFKQRERKNHFVWK